MITGTVGASMSNSDSMNEMGSSEHGGTAGAQKGGPKLSASVSPPRDWKDQNYHDFTRDQKGQKDDDKDKKDKSKDKERED